MRIVQVETLISRGTYSGSADWHNTRHNLHQAIREVDWPHGSGTFAIYPERGKRRREGNGVTPIEQVLMETLHEQGWQLEEPMDIATVRRPGKLDAVRYTENGPVALEWETGNTSSSHRALNGVSG